MCGVMSTIIAHYSEFVQHQGIFQFYLKPYIIYFQDIAQFTKMASYLDSGRRIYCRPYVYCRPYEVDPLVDSRA